MFAAFAGFRFVADRTGLDVDVVELASFAYPSLNLVVYPLVQMVSSPVLRAEAARFIEKRIAFGRGELLMLAVAPPNTSCEKPSKEFGMNSVITKDHY